MINIIENIQGFTQRNNEFYKSIACFPTSAAIALHFKGVDDPCDGLQLEDYLVRMCLRLTPIELMKLTNENGEWILDHKPFQVIPIMEYVCKKLYEKTQLSWAISFNDIMAHIDNNSPVVCLGNFSSLSYIHGHYNCVVGYDSEKKTVITKDPFGNAHTNYADTNGNNMEYDWKIFCQENTKNSYGLLF